MKFILLLKYKSKIWIACEVWNKVRCKNFVKSTQYWNFIYQTHKNFGGNVPAKNCSDDIFTNRSDFSTPATPAFVSKTFLWLIFLKSCYSVTPLIFWLLYKKISFSELTDEIFYKQPVFTEIWDVSKTSTVWPCQSPSLSIFQN